MERITMPGSSNNRMRFLAQRTKSLRDGQYFDPAHNLWFPATGLLDPGFARFLYPRGAPCYPQVWIRLGEAWPILHVAAVEHFPQNAPLAHLFNLRIKANAVPVAASSSGFVSTRPTRPGVRPRSLGGLADTRFC